MFLFIITLFTCGFTYYQANYKQSFDEISVSISDSGSKSITLTKSSSNNVSTLCPVSSANGYEIYDIENNFLNGENYYYIATYNVSCNDTCDNVYIDSITFSSDEDITKAIKVSINVGSSHYIYSLGDSTYNGVNGTGGATLETSCLSVGEAMDTISLTSSSQTMKVIVWLEGNDSNCTNANINAFSGTLKINISLSAN